MELPSLQLHTFVGFAKKNLLTFMHYDNTEVDDMVLVPK